MTIVFFHCYIIQRRNLSAISVIINRLW